MARVREEHRESFPIVRHPAPGTRTPILVSVPHSGTRPLPHITRDDYRQPWFETFAYGFADTFVGDLYADLHEHGATVLTTPFSRIFVDVNRRRDDFEHHDGEVRPGARGDRRPRLHGPRLRGAQGRQRLHRRQHRGHLRSAPDLPRPRDPARDQRVAVDDDHGRRVHRPGATGGNSREGGSQHRPDSRVSSRGAGGLAGRPRDRARGWHRKIRIGVGAGGAPSSPEALAELVAGLDQLGFDSLWLSEVLTGPVPDPVVGLSWAAASNPRLKLGTTMLLPGRNVVRLAKQLASLDVLCRGRLLVTLVPGLTYEPERDAIGVPPKQRGAFIDEALPLLRRLWAGETVSHDGAVGSFRDVKLSPVPVQQPLEVWLGGTVPAALERCGRLSDGWLPSLCTPEEAAHGRVVIEDAAAKAGRTISPEHFGVSIGYATRPIDPATARTMAARRPRSLELTPVGLPALRAAIERFIAVGFSKFVVRPVAAPASWRAELEALASAVGDLQT